MRYLLFLTLIACLFGCEGKVPKKGTYSIGRDLSWFPLNLGEQTPNLNAFTNDLVAEIAKIEDAPLHIIDFSWSQLFLGLEDGVVGGIFTSLSPDTLTMEKYSFSDPFLLLGPVLIVPYDSNAKSLADLEGRFVAVNQFDDSVLIVQRFPSIIISYYQNVLIALEDLKSGKIDGALIPVLEAKALIPKLYPFQLKIVTHPLSNKALRLVTLHGENKKLIKHFNKGLNELRKNGNYDELRANFSLN